MVKKERITQKWGEGAIVLSVGACPSCFLQKKKDAIVPFSSLLREGIGSRDTQTVTSHLALNLVGLPLS
jgi:hypothetical protein